MAGSELNAAQELKAEIVAIGDELTSGQRLDTNSQWLARELGDLGIRTIRHTTICDDLSGNIDAFQAAANRSDVIICTGGLGPTLDDLTRQAMADAFKLELELDQPSLDHIVALFASRKREMPERNRIQAMFPQGSKVVPNPHGSAPGIDLVVPREGQGSGGQSSRFFALPGVPAEMKEMWHTTVSDRIDLMLGNESGKLHYHEVKVFGIGESDVEVKLPDLVHRDRYPTVGITVSRATITLRISGRANSEVEFSSLIAPTVAEINSQLGDLVFGNGNDTLQSVVARLLTERKLTMGCVELGCASTVGDWMLGIEDSKSDCFQGSFAFRTLGSATAALELPHGPEEESKEAAKENAFREITQVLSQRLGVDLVLLVSRYPSMSEMQSARTPFDQFYGVLWNGKFHEKRTKMGGHPDVLGPRIGKTGLDFLRRILMGLE